MTGVPTETLRAVEARFRDDLARRNPGTVWHVEELPPVRETDQENAA